MKVYPPVCFNLFFFSFSSSFFIYFLCVLTLTNFLGLHWIWSPPPLFPHSFFIYSLKFIHSFLRGISHSHSVSLSFNPAPIRLTEKKKVLVTNVYGWSADGSHIGLKPDTGHHVFNAYLYSLNSILHSIRLWIPSSRPPSFVCSLVNLFLTQFVGHPIHLFSSIHSAIHCHLAWLFRKQRNKSLISLRFSLLLSFSVSVSLSLSLWLWSCLCLSVSRIVRICFWQIHEYIMCV